MVWFGWAEFCVRDRTKGREGEIYYCLKRLRSCPSCPLSGLNSRFSRLYSCRFVADKSRIRMDAQEGNGRQNGLKSYSVTRNVFKLADKQTQQEPSDTLSWPLFSKSLYFQKASILIRILFQFASLCDSPIKPASRAVGKDSHLFI